MNDRTMPRERPRTAADPTDHPNHPQTANDQNRGIRITGTHTQRGRDRRACRPTCTSCASRIPGARATSRRASRTSAASRPARADRPATGLEARSDHGVEQPQGGASWTVNSVCPRHLGRTDPRTQDSERYESYDHGRTLSDTPWSDAAVRAGCAHRAAGLPKQRRSSSTDACPARTRSFGCETYPQNLSVR
jgi:hypothetical protein